MLQKQKIELKNISEKFILSNLEKHTTVPENKNSQSSQINKTNKTIFSILAILLLITFIILILSILYKDRIKFKWDNILKEDLEEFQSILLKEVSEDNTKKLNTKIIEIKDKIAKSISDKKNLIDHLKLKKKIKTNTQLITSDAIHYLISTIKSYFEDNASIVYKMTDIKIDFESLKKEVLKKIDEANIV